MLLFHLVDFRLLLLHDLRQLKLVVHLCGLATLGSFLRGVVHLEHLGLPTRLGELHGGSGLFLHVHMVAWVDGLSNLVRDSQIVRVLLVLVHLNGGGSRTLSLVGDLDLAFADLDGGGVLSCSALYHLRFVGNLGQPIRRAVTFLRSVALCDAHVIVM